MFFEHEPHGTHSTEWPQADALFIYRILAMQSRQFTIDPTFQNINVYYNSEQS